MKSTVKYYICHTLWHEQKLSGTKHQIPYLTVRLLHSSPTNEQTSQY
jgi:hypothetical protein